jgi:Beta-galactosidase jelly roll domain/Beta-galactosidase, domain 2/Beta-galactosidase, domain 3/NPCBM-associated, NEW3 domain of alpha-galactosidase
VEKTHISVDLSPKSGFTYDDTASQLLYTGNWAHVSNQSYTAGDYQNTESFSNTAGDSVSITFNGTAVRWISSTDPSHGIANVYLDDQLVATIDGYGPSKQFQDVFYNVSGLSNGSHTLKIVATGNKNPLATGAFVVVDAIDPPVYGPGTYYSNVPQQPGTAITVNGRDAKLLLSNYQFGSQHLVYSTSQVMTNGTADNTDFAVLYDNAGDDGETVLRCSSQPVVRVLEGNATSTWDPASGDLRLNYVHNGLTRVSIRGSNGDFILFLADTPTAEQMWSSATDDGPVLVRGPYLVRSMKVKNHTLILRGDTNANTSPQVLFPPTIKDVRWEGQIGEPPAIHLPTLTKWKFQFESPERNPGFDDSDWTVANHTTTNNPNKPGSLPVLYEDDYGFHHGNVWYRGHFTASGNETGIVIDGEGGGSGIYSVWLNGALIATDPSGSNTFAFPPGVLRAGQDNVIAVLVMNVGHGEDYSPDDSYKSPRGITTAILQGANTPVTWRIQGNRGGEQLIDPVRGPMNTGGLLGERRGWFLPAFPDHDWSSVTLPDRWASKGLPAGIGWYRTTFDLDIPKNTDAPLGLMITDDPSHHYRALIFLNGWMMGIYANELGPQHLFSLPTGILKPGGENTLALAMWSEDGSSGGLGQVALVPYGAYNGGVPVRDVPSPEWNEATWGQPSAPNNLAVALASDHPIISGGEFVNVTDTISNPSDKVTKNVTVTVHVPTGWTPPANPTINILAIGPKQSVSVSWTLQVPAILQAGTYQLAAVSTFQQGGVQQQTTAGTTDLTVPYHSLADAFDNTGTTSNSNTNPYPGFLGFDGIGTTYSAEGLAAAGLTPGATFNANGVQFTWPNVAPAMPDNVLADGQAFQLSGQGSQIGFLAATNNSPLSGTGTVYYTDGSSFDLHALRRQLLVPARIGWKLDNDPSGIR